MVKTSGRELNTETDSLRWRVAELERERTEWVRMKEQLRESGEKFRVLVENLGEGINIVDANQRFTFANRAADEIFGVRPGGLVGRQLSDFTSLRAATTIQSQAMSRRRGVTTTYHLPIIRPDGQQRELLVTGSPKFSLDGEFTSAFAVFRDITAQVEMESALRENVQRVSSAEIVARMGFFEWNLMTNEIHLSRGAKELFRLSPDTSPVTPDFFHRVVHAEDSEFVRNALDLAVRDVEPLKIKCRLVCDDDVWVKIVTEMFRDLSNTPVRLLGTLVDISDRVRVEQKLEQSLHDLERRVEERTRDLNEANDKLAQEIESRHHIEMQARRLSEQLTHVARVSTMGEMATGLAHELNQPLAAISNYGYAGLSALSGRSMANPDELRVFFEKLLDQALRAGEIIHRLRGHVKKREPAFSRVNVVPLIHDVLGLLKFELEHGRIHVEVNADGSGAAATMDEIQIQQVLVNLIRNAVDAMTETSCEERRLTIDVSVAADDMIEVAVSDTGVGVPIQLAERVFDTYLSTKPDGMGMGLAISRTIIEIHGGRLWMEANGDRGARFQFSLPVMKQGT